MPKYFDNPDSSFDESFQEPLKELDLNESTDSFMPIRPSPKKSSKLEIEPPVFRKSNRSYKGLNNKENVTDVEKLPVLHRGPHGEQAGTLIVRHYIQRDSKCIQCRNCGIFFTTDAFLKHCHDQYGKRSNCSAVQLQLGLDNPSARQKDVWNVFQKKLLSNNSDLIIRPDSSAARHIKNIDRSTDDPPRQAIPRENRQRSRIRRSSIDMPPPGRVPDTSTPNFDPRPREFDSALYRSRKFPSSSALDAKPDSLSLSELRSERRNRMTSSYGTHMDRDIRKTLYSGKVPYFDSALPDKVEIRNLQDEYQNATPPNRAENTLLEHSYGRIPPTSTRRWDVPNMHEKYAFPSSQPTFSAQIATENNPIPSEEMTARPVVRSMADLRGGSKDETEDVEAKDLINRAISFLHSASDKISRDKGQNSNAWRKMYEEEREHRMQLEAKVRDLERELRSRKT